MSWDLYLDQVILALSNVSRKQTIFDGDCRKISKLFKSWSYYDVLDV